MSDQAETTTCPECAEEVKPEAVRCKHCGARIHGKQERSHLFWTLAAVALLVLAVLGFFRMMHTSQKAAKDHVECIEQGRTDC